MKRLVLVLVTAAALRGATEADLRRALQPKTGKIVLPPGVIDISREVVLAPDAHDLDIAGSMTVLHAAAAFRGRAMLVVPGGNNVRIHDLSLDGNRDEVGRLTPATPAGTMASRFTANNGILVENVNGLEITGIKADKIAGFAVLVNASHKVTIREVDVSQGGGYNMQRVNSGAGGILLEEGTTDFSVTRCLFGQLRGSAILTRSIAGSALNARGRIAQNEFAVIARDAVQLSDAIDVTLEDNRGRLIGYPPEETDISNSVLPSAVHTVQRVAKITIRGNSFDNIDGRCFTLAGLSDSSVTGNTCSEELFGAMLLSGTNNRVEGNRLLRLNLSHKEEPILLTAGIYLEAASRGNRITGNELAGYGMSKRCVISVDKSNEISKNDCSDEADVAMLRLVRPR